MSLLALENASYYLKGQDRPLLDNLKCSFEAGKIYVIFSQDPLEKSVLTSLLGGLDLFSKGFLRYQGNVVHKENIDDYRRQEAGLFLNDYLGLPKQSLLQNLMTYLEVTESRVKPADCLTQLAGAGIDEQSAHLPLAQAPAILQKRFALVRALARQPRILAAADLFAEIDAAAAKLFCDLLQKHVQERALCVILLTSNNRLAELADECWGLNQRKLLFIHEK